MSSRNKLVFSALTLLFATGSIMAQMRIIPHLTRAGGGFTTTLIFENSSVEDRAYTITPYNESGVAQQRVTGVISGQTVTTFSASSLLGQNASHLVIEGDDITITAAYTANGNDTSPAHVAENRDQATSYRLFAGNWKQVFDGFAVVNAGEETADVWVAQRDGSGNIAKSVKAVEGLAPNAKALYVIGDPNGSEFDPDVGAYYEVYSTQNIAITALRGNIPGSNFLWANEAAPNRQASVTRDAQGVWFIQDGSLYDVMEAMGHSVAFDRMFQMEFLRRVALGRVAEVLGSTSLSNDVFVRQTNYTTEEYWDYYSKMTPEARTVVKAYVDGVNRRIAELSGDDFALFPFEFLSLNLTTLETWSEVDVLAIMVNLLRNFDPNGYATGQFNNAGLLQALETNFPETSSDMFEDLRFLNDPDAPTMIPKDPSAASASKQGKPGVRMIRKDIDFIALADEFNRMRLEQRELLRELSVELKMGSYAWAVSGDKTASGNPIIYSGPQMGFSAPAIVTEGSINGGGLTISGMTVPGVPLIIIGRTPHHAWSMQVGHAHTADLYLESADVLNGAPHRVESFFVAGQGVVDVPIFRSDRGPMVANTPPISWKYAHWGYEFDTVQAFLDLSRAESMDEFGEALTRVAVSQHFCYADRDGNIAYWMSGRDPVRPFGEYRLPQGLAAPPLEYSIDNVRPLAHARNPERGYFGGWNNKADSGYDNAPFSSTQYGPFHRAHAVQDYLAANDNLTFEQVRDLALNIAITDSFHAGGEPWAFVDDVFANIVNSNQTPERLAALEIMDGFDGHFIENEANWRTGPHRSDAWLLQNFWIRRALELTFDDELGVRNYTNWFNTFLHDLDGYTLDNNYDWFSNTGDSEAPQTLESIVVQALDETLASLGDRPWGINRRGAITYSHPAFGVIWQSPLGNRSTYAHCVEFDETGPVRIESMFPLGQSGGVYSDGGVSFVSDQNAFSMTRFFDVFSPRSFPSFEEK